MPEYLAPGVYVEHLIGAPPPIEAVATSTAAFVGETERGPTKPRLVTSHGEFVHLFGDAFRDGCYLPHAARAFFDNGGRRLYVARVTSALGSGDGFAAREVGHCRLRALGPGAAYDRVWARIDAGGTPDQDGGPTGFRLRLAYWEAAPPLGSALFDPFEPANRTELPQPAIVEEFAGVSLDPDSPSHWNKLVNGTSALVTIQVADSAQLDTLVAGSGLLAGGADGAAAGVAAFEGHADQPDARTGLAALALDRHSEVALIAAPGLTDPAVARALIAHCEANRRRFAVIDGPAGKAVPTDLDPRSDMQESRYAAYYFPWIIVADPRSGARVAVPPSGAVCGRYAYTDATRGVWKAPANETVAGALDLEFAVTQGHLELLNSKGVNCIRHFPGRGIRIWGARTLSSDTLWKYVNVQRLFIFLEASIARGTQWVAFEPNDPKLWARVAQAVTLFLRSQWSQGALMGDKEEEAFFVAVGLGRTMTEEDIANGHLIVEIGIAPVRPADFIIFRIFQRTAEAEG